MRISIYLSICVHVEADADSLCCWKFTASRHDSSLSSTITCRLWAYKRRDEEESSKSSSSSVSEWRGGRTCGGRPVSGDRLVELRHGVAAAMVMPISMASSSMRCLIEANTCCSCSYSQKPLLSLSISLHLTTYHLSPCVWIEL